jgi:hypothetical protein
MEVLQRLELFAIFLAPEFAGSSFYVRLTAELVVLKSGNEEGLFVNKRFALDALSF